VCARFPLAARSHRQSLVSDHAALPATGYRRLGGSAASLAAGVGGSRHPAGRLPIIDGAQLILSTTLADLFTPLLCVERGSAVRTSRGGWRDDGFEEGVPEGRQRRLRWRSVDSFFPASLL